MGWWYVFIRPACMMPFSRPLPPRLPGEPRRKLLVELGLGEMPENVVEAPSLLDPLHQRLVVPAGTQHVEADDPLALDHHPLAFVAPGHALVPIMDVGPGREGRVVPIEQDVHPPPGGGLQVAEPG